ncbi:hypothetical protein FACS1894153_0550 [Bacteroidia bacterium]|nr:hypothetical protein FACS1894153_0550 [Bacteroidia bacterium]
MRTKNLSRDKSGKFVKMTRKGISLYSFWQTHLVERCCYNSFLNEIEVMKKEAGFSKNFGKYLGQKLTEKQLSILKEEFLND